MFTPCVPEGVFPLPLEIINLINRCVYESYRRDLKRKLKGWLIFKKAVINGAEHTFQLSVKTLSTTPRVIVIVVTSEEKYVGERAIYFGRCNRPFCEPAKDEKIDRLLECYISTRLINAYSGVSLFDNIYNY